MAVDGGGGLELKATRYTVADRIATVTLHRPDRMNAWTGRMHHEYRWCIARANADPDVRAIVVTGAGRGFCVGGDAEALSGHVRKGGYDPGTPATMPQPGWGTDALFDHAFAFHWGLDKPVIAAINGAVAGVGLALACFADLRYAAAGARMTTAHGRLNLPAEYGLSWLLPRMVGLTRANDLLLFSRKFTSEDALAMGLVNAVVPAEGLLERTYAEVRDLITTISPDSLRQTRWQVYRDLHRDVRSSVADSEQLLDRMMKDPDFAEGVRALNAREQPRWSRS